MKILSIDKKNNSIKAIPENMDDLWHLEKIIEIGDLISGSTDRRIKAKDIEQKSERIKLFVVLEVEKAEFHKFSGKLRVQGIIVEGKPPELIELKSHQAIEIELGQAVAIKKKALKKYQVERLKKAEKAGKRPAVLLVVLDDETASFGLLKEFELEAKGAIRSGSRGKRFKQDEGVQNKYFNEIMAKAKEINSETIVFAGPGFEKDSLKKFLESKSIKGNFLFANTNSTGITGLQELMKSNVLEKIAEQRQIRVEAVLVEEVLAGIGKNTGLAEYGFEQAKKAAETGAVKELLVLDSLLLQDRQKTEAIMDSVEKANGTVHIINAEQEPGKKLEGLGGIAVLLKFKLKY